MEYTKILKSELTKLRSDLANTKKLHQAARTRVIVLEAENQVLKARIKELEQKDREKDELIKDLQYQLQELRTVVFGKQKKAKMATETEDDDDTEPPTPRTKESYQRPIPKDSEITKVIHHRFPRDKHGNIRLRTYYVEDIPLSIDKIVEKHAVEQYYDTKRRTWVSRSPLPTTIVTLGDNVRVLITTLITVDRLSYSQVQRLLKSLFKINVSSGEIANILTKEAQLLTPAKDVLLANIQTESSYHLDESRYDVNSETHYVWSITGGESDMSVYRVGVSRGKGNAELLRGNSTGVLVSDDYGAYRNLATHHQLCWAHLIRHFRDLANHTDFTPEQVSVIKAIYTEIKAIYHETKQACMESNPLRYRTSLTERLTAIAQIQSTDPKPVQRHKTTLLKNIQKYFTCLSFPVVALTNNTAERSLRHLVLKRKISFGVRNHQSANTMSVLFSVLLNLRRKDPLNYFEKYLEVRRG